MFKNHHNLQKQMLLGSLWLNTRLRVVKGRGNFSPQSMTWGSNKSTPESWWNCWCIRCPPAPFLLVNGWFWPEFGGQWLAINYPYPDQIWNTPMVISILGHITLVYNHSTTSMVIISQAPIIIDHDGRLSMIINRYWPQPLWNIIAGY